MANIIIVSGTVKKMNRNIYINGKEYYLYLIDVRRKSGTVDSVITALRGDYDDGSYVYVNGYLKRREAKKEKDGLSMTFIVSEDERMSDDDTEININNFSLHGRVSAVSGIHIRSNGARKFRSVRIVTDSGCSIPCVVWLRDASWNIPRNKIVNIKGRFQGKLITDTKTSFEIIANESTVFMD